MSPFCQVSLGGRRPRGVTVAVQKSFIIRCSFSPPSRSIPPRRRVNNTHLFQYYHINVKVQLSPNGKTKSDVAFKKCSAAVRATQIRIYEFYACASSSIGLLAFCMKAHRTPHSSCLPGKGLLSFLFSCSPSLFFFF